MHGVRGPDKEVPGSGDHHGAGSPQKIFVNWNQVPQSVRYMLRETESQIPCVFQRDSAFSDAAVQYGVKLSQCPER